MALTKTDKSMLGGVDDDNSPSSLVERTNDGRVKVSDATENDDAVSKGQVDAELEQLTQNSNTVNVVEGGGTLSSDQTNELQVAGVFNLPAANSVPANKVCSLIVQNKHKAGAKTINVQGTDTVSDEVGTDTSIVLKDGFSGRVYLISDGVSDWRY